MKQKAYETIPIEKRLSLEAWLHGYLEDIAPELRQKIHADREGWFAEYHFDWGMNVRNAMRKHGFTETWLGVKNLDDVYVEAIEHAILVNSVGEIMVPVTSYAIVPFWNRKRLFIAAVLMITAFIITMVLN